MSRISLILSAFALAWMIGIQTVDVFAELDDESAVSALKAANDVPWAHMTIRIVDPDGKPVAGARVRPWALRAGNGHGWWGKDNYGSPQRTTSDQDGKTVVVFPESVKQFDVQHPVVEVSISVAHDDFCSRTAHVAVSDGDPPILPTVALEGGFTLRIAGVAPGSDQPLSDCHAMLENGDTGEPEFVQRSDGWLQSVPVRSNRRWFRVIRTAPGMPVEFSKPQAWSPDDPASREVRVEVKSGVRLMGRISDDVPRPIERGYVVVWCGSPVRNENKVERANPIWWIDTVPINKDGTFEFSSLPPGYLAQIYAIANDWISAQPTDEAFETCCKWFGEQSKQRNTFFRYGQVLRLSGNQAEVTVEMEPAAQVRVKCVDPNGNPLRRVLVSSWPNQYMVGGGSTILCNRFSSLDRFRKGDAFDFTKSNPFTAETDAEGIAVIHNLPQGQQSLVAGNDLWKSKQNETITTDPDNTAEITITLQSAR